MTHSSLIQKFQNNVARYPDHCAIYYNGVSLSYVELNNKIIQYAKKIYIHSQGCRDNFEAKVCILGKNKLEAVVLKLATLFCGFVFISLPDSESVEITCQKIHAASATLVVLVDSSNDALYRAIKNECSGCLSIDDLQDSSSYIDDFIMSTTDHTIAYFLYTSGSTGTQKAVIQTHGGIHTQVARYTEELSIPTGEVVSNIAGLFHDQGIVDVFTGLLTPRGTLCLIDFDLKQEGAIERVLLHLRKAEVSLLSTLPDIFSLLFANVTPELMPHLQRVALGADLVTKKHLNDFIRSCPDHSTLVVSYGASECSFIGNYLITKTLARKMMDTDALPIARKDSLNMAQSHTEGELCIAGAGIGIGYWNGSGHPMTFFRGEYATGDYVSTGKDPDGRDVLYFLSRSHDRVKISGKLVVLREVQEQLEKSLAIDVLFVIPYPKETPQYLIAVVQDATVQSCTPMNLTSEQKDAIKSSLSPHCLPQLFLKVKESYRLPNGKLDRKKHYQEIHEFISIGSQNSILEVDVLSISNLWMSTFACRDIESASSLTKMMFLGALSEIFEVTFSYLELTRIGCLDRFLDAVLQRYEVTHSKICYLYDSKGFLELNFFHLTSLIERINTSKETNIPVVLCHSLNVFSDKMQETISQRKPSRTLYATTLGYSNISMEMMRFESKDPFVSAHYLGCLVEYCVDETTQQSTLRLWLYDQGSNNITGFLSIVKDLPIPTEVYLYADNKQLIDVESCRYFTMNFLEEVSKFTDFKSKFLLYSAEDSAIIYSKYMTAFMTDRDIVLQTRELIDGFFGVSDEVGFSKENQWLERDLNTHITEILDTEQLCQSKKNYTVFILELRISAIQHLQLSMAEIKILLINMYTSELLFANTECIETIRDTIKAVFEIAEYAPVIKEVKKYIFTDPKAFCVSNTSLIRALRDLLSLQKNTAVYCFYQLLQFQGSDDILVQVDETVMQLFAHLEFGHSSLIRSP